MSIKTVYKLYFIASLLLETYIIIIIILRLGWEGFFHALARWADN